MSEPTDQLTEDLWDKLALANGSREIALPIIKSAIKKANEQAIARYVERTESRAAHASECQHEMTPACRCRKCGKTMAEIEAAHASGEGYPCTRCDASYDNAPELVKHLRAAHPSEQEIEEHKIKAEDTVS